IDTHDDIPTEEKGVDRTTPVNIAVASPKAHTDLPRLREGGVGAVFFVAWVASSYAGSGDRAFNRAQQLIDTIHHDIVDRNPKDFAFATTADQSKDAHKQSKIAALIGVEGGHAIGENLDHLR